MVAEVVLEQKAYHYAHGEQKVAWKRVVKLIKRDVSLAKLADKFRGSHVTVINKWNEKFAGQGAKKGGGNHRGD